MLLQRLQRHGLLPRTRARCGARLCALHPHSIAKRQCRNVVHRQHGRSGRRRGWAPRERNRETARFAPFARAEAQLDRRMAVLSGRDAIARQVVAQCCIDLVRIEHVRLERLSTFEYRPSRHQNRRHDSGVAADAQLCAHVQQPRYRYRAELAIDDESVARHSHHSNVSVGNATRARHRKTCALERQVRTLSFRSDGEQSDLRRKIGGKTFVRMAAR